MNYLFLAEERDHEVVKRLPADRTVLVTVDGTRAAIAPALELIAVCGYSHVFAVGQLAAVIAHLMKADAQMDLFGYVCLESGAPRAVPHLALVASPSLAVLVITAQYGEVPEALVETMLDGGYADELAAITAEPPAAGPGPDEVH